MTANCTYKKYSRVGPGGMNCPCCGPAPGKKRKWFMRYWKRQERRLAISEAVIDFQSSKENV